MAEVLPFPGSDTPNLPSKRSGNAGRHKKQARGPELYPTPPPLTRAFLSRALEIGLDGSLIWEPAAGLGHMTRELRAAGYLVNASDLVDYGTPDVVAGVNFFDISEANVDAIVTNPPFTLAQKFVEHGLTLCPMVCILARLAFMESQSRKALHANHLQHVFAFEERAPMMHRWSQDKDGIWREWQGKKAGSAVAHAWFVFTREKDGPTTIETLSWKAYATKAELEAYSARKRKKVSAA